MFLGGLSLPASTPFTEIFADQPGFEGIHVEVEGFVVYTCPMSRNRAVLRDFDGNEMTIAGNHAFDVVAALEIGRYVVAEGIFYQWYCRRGPHVNFGEHGGMVGNVVCPID